MKAGPLAGYQATEPKEPSLPLSDQWVGSQVQQTAVIWAQEHTESPAKSVFKGSVSSNSVFDEDCGRWVFGFFLVKMSLYCGCVSGCTWRSVRSPWFFNGKGIVSLSLLRRFFISLISLSQHSRVLLNTRMQLLTSQLHSFIPLFVYSFTSQIKTHTHGSVNLLFYVVYVSGHQPAELRTVSGGGGGVFKDRDV